jgi:hypothetical protein
MMHKHTVHPERSHSNGEEGKRSNLGVVPPRTYGCHSLLCSLFAIPAPVSWASNFTRTASGFVNVVATLSASIRFADSVTRPDVVYLIALDAFEVCYWAKMCV